MTKMVLLYLYSLTMIAENKNLHITHIKQNLTKHSVGCE